MDSYYNAKLPKQNIVIFLKQVNLLPDGGKKCCCYGYIPKREESISPSDFHHLTFHPTFPGNDLVFFCFCCVRGVGFVAVAELLSLKGTSRYLT